MTVKEMAEKSVKITYTYKVTPDVYFAFQKVSSDYNPLHTDEEFSKVRGFQGRVMYGNILNAFVSHFVGMLLPTRNVMIQSQDISFHKPVYLNDEVLLETGIDNVYEALNIINYKFKFKRLGGTKTEMVAKGHVQIGLIKD